MATGGVVVFTGTLTLMTRKQASAEAQRHGYKVGASLTKATDFLVCGAKAGKKVEDAKKLNVGVLSEAEWLAKLQEGASDEGDSAAMEVEPVKQPKPKRSTRAKTTTMDENPSSSTMAGAGKSQDDVVVFTGTLTRQTRKAASAEAEALGFRVGASITSATTILVCGEKAGKKAEEAQKKNITVYNEEQWGAVLDAMKSDPVSNNSAYDQLMNTDEPQEQPEDMEVNETPSIGTDPVENNDLVVFTGTLMKQSRKEATAQAQQYGYRVGNSVTKLTTILVCGEKAGKKMEDARKRNIAVYTEEEWEKRLATEQARLHGQQATRKRKADTDIENPSSPKKVAVSSGNDEVELVFDSETGAINGIFPKTLLPDGEFHTVNSTSSNSTYDIKRIGSVYSCTCMAWKKQRHPATSRTCKHLKEVLGEEYEALRASASASAPRAQQLKGKTTKAMSPALLLAKKWERESHDPVGWWISEKLDGVRAYWDAKNRQFLSRNGNVYPAPEWFTNNFPDDLNLDGELFGGRGKFQTTVGIAKTANSKNWSQLVYKVFDIPSIGKASFEDRMKKAQELVTSAASAYLEWVEHTICRSVEHLDEELERIEKLGGEGLMIRQPNSQYHDGRSSTLLKIKSFHDGEAIVVGHDAGKGKYTNMVGALKCKMANGKMFKVSSGLSDAEREKPKAPKIGTIIVYKCQELTDGGLPRFPIYLGVAADKTEPKDPVIGASVADE